jgi:hypothetical protein
MSGSRRISSGSTFVVVQAQPHGRQLRTLKNGWPMQLSISTSPSKDDPIHETRCGLRVSRRRRLAIGRTAFLHLPLCGRRLSLTSGKVNMSNLKAQAALRSSGSILAEIDRLNSELNLAGLRLKVLTAGYDAAILAGDKEAEANETETTLTKRTIRRAELQLVALNVDLDSSLEREREAAAQAKRDKANAAVAAVMRKFDVGYREPAKLIADFLIEYDAANKLAFEADVPTVHKLTRFKAGTVEPAYERPKTVFIDESGAETDNPYPAGAYRKDDQGRRLNNLGQPLPMRPQRQKVETVPARRHPDVELPYLSRAVELPRLTLDDEPAWTIE